MTEFSVIDRNSVYLDSNKRLYTLDFIHRIKKLDIVKCEYRVEYVANWDLLIAVAQNRNLAGVTATKEDIQEIRKEVKKFHS